MMNDRNFSGALPADIAAPPAPLAPAAEREAAAGQPRDDRGRFAKAHRIVERPPILEASPWHQAVDYDPARDPILELRDKLNRRAKINRVIEALCIGLGVFIILYFAAQFLRQWI
jgi:hypothetical protein